MFGAADISAFGALAVLVMLIIWIVVLVWVAARIQGFMTRQAGWPALDWRNVLASIVVLIAAIQLGNFILDWIDRWLFAGSYPVGLGFPGAFLIGSVAIGVGIAAVRTRREK